MNIKKKNMDNETILEDQFYCKFKILLIQIF